MSGNYTTASSPAKRRRLNKVLTERSLLQSVRYAASRNGGVRYCGVGDRRRRSRRARLAGLRASEPGSGARRVRRHSKRDVEAHMNFFCHAIPISQVTIEAKPGRKANEPEAQRQMERASRQRIDTGHDLRARIGSADPTRNQTMVTLA